MAVNPQTNRVYASETDASAGRLTSASAAPMMKDFMNIPVSFALQMHKPNPVTMWRVRPYAPSNRYSPILTVEAKTPAL